MLKKWNFNKIFVYFHYKLGNGHNADFFTSKLFLFECYSHKLYIKIIISEFSSFFHFFIKINCEHTNPRAYGASEVFEDKGKGWEVVKSLIRLGLVRLGQSGLGQAGLG